MRCMRLYCRQHHQVPYSYCAMQRTVDIQGRSLQSSNGVQLRYVA